MAKKIVSPAMLHDNQLCTGCAACVNVCHNGALNIGTDEFGYFRPDFDAALCVECGRCLSVCPVLHNCENKNLQEPRCFAVAMEDVVRELASSGGVFPTLAADILKRGGYVCGAAWNESFGVEHVLIDDIKDLHRLCKSKYMQSYIGDIFRQIKALLEEGKEVLFAGCPCQVAGLYAALGRGYDKLNTIDLICAYTPSSAFFKKYLRETFGENTVREYDFRSKRTGWSDDTHRVVLKDGQELIRHIWDDPYQQAFHPRIMTPIHCERCRFCGFPRQGDLSIGDFHGIDQHDPSVNDQRGLSAVLVNNGKGERLLEVLQSRAVICKETPLDWVKQHNRVRLEGFESHPDRDRFYELIQTHSFEQTVDFLQNHRYDIGIVGNWSWANYGSELTYYALYSVLKQMGYSVLMVGWPKESGWVTYERPTLFGKCPYPEYAMEPVYERKRDMKALNDRCKVFIQGSDQLFNNQLYHAFGKIITLDWVYSYKTKIAYAISFGHDYGRMRPELWGSDYDRAEMAHFMQQFDAFSVREDSAKYITKNHFGVEAEWVLDPIFLCERSAFEKLADSGDSVLPQIPYLFSYVLDPDFEKGKMLKQCAHNLGLSLRVVPDGELTKEKVESSWDIDTLFNVTIEQWIAHIRSANFIITDSFHGICLSIIFHKNFIAIANPIRGVTRFESLLGLFGLRNRMVEDLQEIPNRPELLEPIDYSNVGVILEREVKRCREWLCSAIEKNKVAPLSTFDMLDIRGDALEADAKSHVIEAEKRVNVRLNDMGLNINNRVAEVAVHIDNVELDMRNLVNGLSQSIENHLAELDGSLNTKTQKLEQESISLQQELIRLQQEQVCLRDSVSYRLGRSLTWLPRKMRGGLRCLRDNGVSYTWRDLLKKIRNRF